MNKDELQKILEQHLNWILNKPDGVRANLRGANLGGADLRGANLYRADLRGADLRGANLGGADLGGANLYRADLRGANLYRADLRGADLGGADLGGADLRGANLRGADLRGADLRGADLRGADLYGADLYGVNLRWADLRGADLRGADLRGVNNVPYVPMTCPDCGSFIGWKKVKNEGKFLVKLLIPEDAKRSSATGRKCRCDKAMVLEIVDLETDESVSEVTNLNYHTTTYKVGDMVYSDAWDEERFHECSHGIHFFINRQEAVDYVV